MKVEYVHFADRSARSRYIADRFRRFLAGSVLDVGCDRAVLRTLLPDLEYTGLDVAGDPDTTLDLEGIERLPYGEGAFDCVVCSDVLEHIDNLHRVFDEIVRVAKRHIIISLPNNWANARRPIERGKGAIGHYGLPVDLPPDRHKWFFNVSEAADFVKEQEKKHPVSIVELHVTEKPRPLLLRAFRRLLFPSQERYMNRYAHTLWVVFEKR